jgi:hypothetical protein
MMMKRKQEMYVGGDMGWSIISDENKLEKISLD